jgi:hypothetical protein
VESLSRRPSRHRIALGGGSRRCNRRDGARRRRRPRAGREQSLALALAVTTLVHLAGAWRTVAVLPVSERER